MDPDADLIVGCLLPEQLEEGVREDMCVCVCVCAHVRAA